MPLLLDKLAIIIYSNKSFEFDEFFNKNEGFFMKRFLYIIQFLTVFLSASAMDFKQQETPDFPLGAFEGTRFVLIWQEDGWHCPFCTHSGPSIVRHIPFCRNLPMTPQWFLQFQTSYLNYSFTVNWRMQQLSSKKPLATIGEYGCAYCSMVTQQHNIMGHHMISKHKEHITSMLNPHAPSALQPPRPLKRPQEASFYQKYEKSQKRLKCCGQTESPSLTATSRNANFFPSTSDTDYKMPVSAIDNPSRDQTPSALPDGTTGATKYILQTNGDKFICPFCSYKSVEKGIFQHMKLCRKQPQNLNWFVQFQKSFHNYSFIMNWYLKISPVNPSEKCGVYSCAYCTSASLRQHQIDRHMENCHKEQITPRSPQTSLLDQPTDAIEEDEAFTPFEQLPQADPWTEMSETQSEERVEYASELYVEEPCYDSPALELSNIEVPFTMILNGNIILISAWYNLETNTWSYECKHENCHHRSAPTDNIFTFIIHLCNHANKKIFACTYDSFESNNIIEFQKHKKSVHNQEISAEQYQLLINIRDQMLAARDSAQFNSPLSGASSPLQ